MTIQNMNPRLFLPNLNLFAAISIILIAFAGSAVAQSSDPDHPTPMTTNEVKGRWARGSKAFSHFYSFVAGPGEVRVSFFFVADDMLLMTGGQLIDANGVALTELNAYEQQTGQLNYDMVYGVATTGGVRLVGRFNIKRRQKLTIRAYSAFNNSAEGGGSYKIHIEGGDPSFGGDIPSTSSGKLTTNLPANTTGAGNLSCMPKAGKLRLVMDDGTVQEINLSRVREATVKP